VVTLNAPHMGSPFATPEWLRHTVSRLGFCAPKLLGLMLESTVAQCFLTGWMSTGRQSDLDMAWGNYDAASGYGLPCEDFRVFRWDQGFTTLTVSLRDANRTGARDLSGCVDNTFEPPELLSTYCGGLNEIMPRARGDLYIDKFFVYGSYLVPEEGCIQQTLRNVCGVFDWFQILLETAGLGISHALMGAVETPGTDVPLGAYRLGDGLVPLQSQLMLDGQEGDLIYETQTVLGWRLPTFSPKPKEDVIVAHTLADPNRLRILRGWNHSETVSGRYNVETGHSELFGMVADDLLGAVDSSLDTAHLSPETRHE
jgi:hypothetical protein